MGCTESKTDPEFKPTNVRGCTDVFWLVLYIVFWLFMIGVAAFAFVYGNPMRLINGYDSFGNTCNSLYNEHFQNINMSGQNTLGKPYVFFLDIAKIRHTLKLCVKKCPDRKIENAHELYKFYQETDSKLCRYDFNMTLLTQAIPPGMNYFNFLGPCPKTAYKSTPILHRCIPTGEGAPGERVVDAYNSLNSWTAAQQLLADLYTTWPLIVAMCFAALVLSIVVIGLMNWMTNIISWFICIFVTLASIAITVILWLTYFDIHNKQDTSVKYSQLMEFVNNEYTVYVLAIIATVVMIVIIAAVLFIRKKLSGLAALFEEASKCMLSMPSLVVPGILAFFVLAVFLAFWVAVVLCLATAKYPDKETSLAEQAIGNVEDFTSGRSGEHIQLRHRNNTEADYKSFIVVEYHEVNWLRNMLWIYLIGLVWTSEFIFACQQMALAGAVALWYFRMPTETPVLHSVCKLFKYHLGSMAKGSILITLFKIPRLILTYLYAKLKKGEDNDSQCAQCGMKTCICCFWFLERFLRYLNHNTYTVIAIESINFCPAAGVAWNALMSNSFQVATINGIGDFILFLGKLAVGLMCGLASILLLRSREDIHFYIIPCVFIGVFAFLIAHIMLSLYEMVVDTLFLCVCEDRTINGPNGRWRESNLAHLLGEEPVEEAVMQTVELTPINKQPFSLRA